MKKPVNLSGEDGKPFEIVIDKFGRGVMTLFDDTRLPLESVATATNMWLDQDGVWTTRPDTINYGKPLTGPIDGGGTITVYNTDGTVTTTLWVVDNGTFKTCQDGGNWSTISGGTFTTGHHVTGLQIASLDNAGVRKNLLLLANGYDTLCYYDITDNVIETYSSISAPTGVTATKGGLSTGNYNVYYAVTAVNAVGETLASSEASVSGGISLPRDEWTSTDHVDVSWTSVSGATRYNIYYADQSGQLVWLDSSNINSYRDGGTATPNPYQLIPEQDSTAGGKWGDLCLSGNRIWTTRHPNMRYRVGWTGTGPYMGAHNPYYGGGYVELEKGGSEIPEKVIHFRTGKGDAAACVLTSDPNGGGSTWFISLTTLSVDSLTIVIPSLIKQQGSVGTRSPWGVITYNDTAYFPSPKGFQSTGSVQSILNVLVTREISSVIRPTIQAVNNAVSESICGIASNGRILWSVPYGSTTNNRVLVLDVERRNAWALFWSIGIKQFFEYTDNDGVIHTLGVPVNSAQLVEFKGRSNTDSGAVFETLLQSGLIHASRNHMSWFKLDKSYVELADPTGTINFSVSGTGRNKSFSTVKTRSIVGSNSVSGFGDDMFGNIQFGDSSSSSSTFTQPSVKKVIKINKKLNNFRWSLSTNKSDSHYTLMQLRFTGTILETSDPQTWKQ